MKIVIRILLIVCVIGAGYWLWHHFTATGQAAVAFQTAPVKAAALWPPQSKRYWNP